MKSMYMNYFKEGKLYQWDENKETYLIQDTNIKEEFCLEKNDMDTFLKFKDPTITLGQTLVVKSGKVKANIKLSDTKLALPNLDFDKSFKINVDKIKIASKFTAKTVGGRPILTGVNVKANFIAATDSFAMYRVACENECNLTITNSFIKNIASLNGELEFKANDNIVACEVDGVTYIGRLLLGQYPDIAKIYEGYGENEIALNKKELKEYLAYANGGYVIFNKNKLVINEIASIENCNFEIELDLPIEEAFCVAYEKLKSVVDSIAEDDVVISYKKPTQPILFNNEFVICPCKL